MIEPPHQSDQQSLHHQAGGPTYGDHSSQRQQGVQEGDLRLLEQVHGERDRRREAGLPDELCHQELPAKQHQGQGVGRHNDRRDEPGVAQEPPRPDGHGHKMPDQVDAACHENEVARCGLGQFPGRAGQVWVTLRRRM